ncbi:MAG: ABC transporter substrate-binding protein [Candidatus Xenobia bacterium]
MRRVWWIALLAIGLMGTGCTPGRDLHPPIRIGTLLATSGLKAEYGRPEQQTLEWLAEETNAAGGIHGSRIELLEQDTGGDVGRARDALHQLAAQGVAAVVGPSTRAECVACSPLADAEKMPVLLLSAGGPSTVPWAYTIAQSDLVAVRQLYDHLLRQDVSRVALLCASDRYGEDGRAELASHAADYHLSVVGSWSVDLAKLDDTTLAPILKQVEQSKAEALIVWAADPAPPHLAQAARRAGITWPILCSPAVGTAEFLRAAGSAAEGIVFPASPLMVSSFLPDSNVQKPALLDYEKGFQQRFHEAASPYGGRARDAFLLLREALLQVGPDRGKIRAFIEERRNWIGVTGVYSFSPADHNGLSQQAFRLIRIEQGKWTLVP